MNTKDVKQVGIVGCGSMGPTIGAAIAAKYRVVVTEVNEGAAEAGLRRILACFPALIRKGTMTEVERELAFSRVKMTTDLSGLKDCQLIIDATPDSLEIKSSVLQKLNAICSPGTVFATTSSLMSVTALAAASGRPDRFIGTHFCNPAHIMALVEVAPAIQTDRQTIDFMLSFLKELGKTAVLTKDSPGLIVNYVFFPFLVRAIEALEAGLGTVEDIDNAIKLGLGHRMGPFELMDLFGMQSNVTAFRTLFEQLNDKRYAPPPILLKMVEAGYLGKHSGKGWYSYDENGKKLGPTV